MYIYIHIYIYIYIYIYICIYLYVYIYICVHTSIYTPLHFSFAVADQKAAIEQKSEILKINLASKLTKNLTKVVTFEKFH